MGGWGNWARKERVGRKDEFTSIIFSIIADELMSYERD